MSDSSPLLPGPNGAEDFTDSPDGANLEANHGADIPHKHTLEPLSGMQSHTREISNLLPEIAKGHVTVDPPIQEERRESNHSKSRDASSVADINHEYLHTEPMIGLTDQQIDDRLAIFGSNELAEEKVSQLKKFLAYFGGAISVLLEVAIVISIITYDWADMVILILVLVINACIGYHEEAKAESALDALKSTLSAKCKSIRNGELMEIKSQDLVPGDIIALRLGDIIPADCKLLGIGVSGDKSAEGCLYIDQSALTGESVAVKKYSGDVAYSSSIVKQGQMLCVVTKTGANTYIGRAANLISTTNEQGHFQKIINQIGNFLIAISLFMVTILLIALSLTPDDHGKLPLFLDVLRKVLIITIAAIPLGLPTVMSVTMAMGSKELAAKQVIVKRLPAIEELASVSILCSDKTGTLTLNSLTLDKPYLANRGSTANNMDGDGKGTFSSQELIRYAYLASEPGADDPIELAVRNAADMTLPELLAIPKVSDYKIISFCPFNPNSKYTEATVQNLTTKETFKVMKGASQIVAAICGGHAKGEEAVVNFSMKGIRALGVARTFDADMKVFQLIGMLSLLDPPRHDSQDTVRACMAFGVDVKMITGDQLIIAKSMASRLGMNRNIFDGKRLDEKKSPEEMSDFVMKSGGFAQVVPEHKYRMVEILQNRGYLVGMTGDGVNDAPALKKANVGIAVHGCTDAARAAADIVLLAPGLGTIVDGIITSRKIFQRMKSYSSNIPINLVYRIASTVHFLLFFFIALLALPRFEMSDRLVILIAVLNDAATLVISVDSAKVSPKPDKWRLGQLIVLSTVLGLLLTGMSFVTYFIAQANGLTDAQISTVMYLQISSCPHFVIFSTRTHGWFWESIPSPTFLFAVIGTQIFAMLICVYGVADLGSTAVGWNWGLGILGTSFLCFIVLDVVKVVILRYWSLELVVKLWPSRRNVAKLARRKKIHATNARVQATLKKLKKVEPMLKLLRSNNKE